MYRCIKIDWINQTSLSNNSCSSSRFSSLYIKDRFNSNNRFRYSRISSNSNNSNSLLGSITSSSNIWTSLYRTPFKMEDYLLL